jgi:alcohol dehydrogenase
VIRPFDFELRTRVVFGAGTLDRLGELALDLGFTRTLIVADRGIVDAGIVDRAAAALDAAGISVFRFHDFGANPDTRMVEAGRVHAVACNIDSLVALGGGSSLDCAKGINFVVTNGGTMRDYRGFGKARRPMLPSIGVPTTAGTGSDAQSYAIISDAETHAKMACGDVKAAFRIAILDPTLTVSQPTAVTAVAGFDALSHAVESYVTTRRTGMSDLFALNAWRLLDQYYARVLAAPDDLAARAGMLVGAHEAGIAIEQSMLGAAHACANPVTAHYGTPHGVAIAVLLPHVVRWNGVHADDRYAELLRVSGADLSGETDTPGQRLAARLDAWSRAGALPATLEALGVARKDLPLLASDAATQWTGTFNPRPFDADGALEIYERAY